MSEQLYRIRPIKWLEKDFGHVVSHDKRVLICHQSIGGFSLWIMRHNFGYFDKIEEAKSIAQHVMDEICELILEPAPNPAIDRSAD